MDRPQNDHATGPEETQKKSPSEGGEEDWAMDWRGAEGASLVEFSKQMPDKADVEEREEPQQSPQTPGQQGFPLSEELLETTVANAHTMLFDGLTWATAQDMRLSEAERVELVRYGTPMMKQMLPEGQKYAPGALWGIMLVNVAFKKFDIEVEKIL
jgi:hypothetical protein